MTLATYRKKRHFNETPEPRGKAKHTRGGLRFVVQKHHATRLHYDFRLELDGVLKSWAVPKGPSLNPADRRLAMMVEDHPFESRTFEGIIPAGNYGAGRVIVWDEGTWEVLGGGDRQSAARMAREGLAQGNLKFVLHGQKLNGEFSLIKLKRGEENAWLLFKKRDEFASDEDITADDRSVTTGRTLDELGPDPRGRGRTKPKAKPKPKSKPAQKKSALMPRDVRPMLATLVDEPFDREGWVFEVKWDGYRAIAEVDRDRVRLYSRNLKSFESKFVPIFRALRDLGHDAVLDGEIVAVDDQGRAQFQLLQNYQRTGRGDLVYYAFDLLYLDGRDLRDLPLIERKEALRRIVRDSPYIRFSDHIETQGISFFKSAVEAGLEGIIGKDSSSLYRDGTRSASWVKIKSRQRQEVVIGGFTAPRGSRVDLGALVLGVFEGGKLVYVGHAGGGFNDAGLADMRKRLERLIVSKSPFEKPPRTNAPVQWVEPKLVCEVEFQEWTEDGRLRQPIFIGLREDKPATDVRREKPMSAASVTKRPSAAKRGKAAPPSTERDEIPKLTNLDKVYWPKDGYTKGDLIEYYRAVSSFILPHLRDRPMSLHRHPDGTDGESFFQKDVSKRPPPEWVRTEVIDSDSRRDTLTYIVCDDEPTLLYLANLGCIELNPWLSRVGSLDEPDFLVIDLDPEAIPFSRVVEAAIAVHKTLDRAGIDSVCKTSGKSGLHICVPLGAEYDYELARQFAELVASIVHRQLPKTTSLERSPSKRQKRVYLDYLQNSRGQTIAAPYSVRPAPGAPVSTPLRWREVRRGLDPSRFTIKNTLKRLDKVGDLWAPILADGVDLAEKLGRLSKWSER